MVRTSCVRYQPAAEDGDGFVDGGQGVLAAAQPRQAIGLVVQRHGGVGQEGVGAAARECAADGDGFVDGGQGVLAAAQPRQAIGLVVQRHGGVGQEGVGAAAREYAADGDGFVDGGQAILAAAGLRQPDAQVDQAGCPLPSGNAWAVGRLVLDDRGDVGHGGAGHGLRDAREEVVLGLLGSQHSGDLITHGRVGLDGDGHRRDDQAAGAGTQGQADQVGCGWLRQRSSGQDGEHTWRVARGGR